ncbi:glycosyl transferase [Bacillus pseudomycoides]|nr:glycosyl transferase [Bacillus pseudomycoides]
MKILYLVSTLERCGPINVLYNIIQNMDKKRFTPIICTFSSEKSNSCKKEFEDLGVQIYSFNINGLLPVLIKGKNIKNIVDKINPDVIHSHGIRGDLFTAFYLKDYYTVSTIHNYPYEDYVMAYKKIVGTIMAVINLYAFRKIEFPVACSYTVSEKIKKKTCKDYKVIQNGIDTNIFSFVDYQQKKEIRQVLEIPKEKNVYLFLGALIPRKNPTVVIEAFKKFNKNLDSMLLIVGDGELYNTCEKHIGTDKNIKLIGKVNNPEDYYAAADFYIAGSSSEGLPMAVMEAMSTGLPVILSDIESHREILRSNETAGLLFECNNIDSLTQKMEQILHEEYNVISLAAYNLISKHLSAEIMTKKYERVYEKTY